MTTTDPKKSKSLTPIILLFVIISAVLVIIFVLSNNKSKSIVNNTNDNQQTNNNSQKLKPIIPNWNVYENKEYGFRIDYPVEWTVKDGNFISPKIKGYFPVIINIDNKFPDLSLEEWIKKESYINLGNFDEGFLKSKNILSDYYVDEINLDGVEALKITNLSMAYFIPLVYKDSPEFKTNPESFFAECGCDFDIDRIFVKKNNIIIHIFGSYDMHASDTQNKLIIKNGRYEIESPDPIYNESKETFNKMISSFRWIK